MKISFLASHGGSSARTIINAMAQGELDAEPGIIITNNRDAGIYKWCIEQTFPVAHVSSATHPQSEDAEILSRLKEAGTDVLVCSGYMKKIGKQTLSHYDGRILNIHPSLLPLHGGQGMYGDRVHEAVLRARAKETGATVHLVTADYDDGPVLGQSRVEVMPGDTIDTLRQRVQATEPALYIQCLKSFLTGY